jgi:hypothetical protein
MKSGNNANSAREEGKTKIFVKLKLLALIKGLIEQGSP